MVSICESLNDAVDLLSLFGKVNLHQQFAGGHVERFAEEGKLAHETTHDVVKKFVLAFGQECWDLRSIHQQFDTFKVLNGRLAFFAFWKSNYFSAEAQ